MSLLTYILTVILFGTRLFGVLKCFFFVNSASKLCLFEDLTCIMLYFLSFKRLKDGIFHWKREAAKANEVISNRKKSSKMRGSQQEVSDL